MNEEQFGPVVSVWLKEGNRPPVDPTASVHTAMDAAAKTRQLGRSRWLPPFVHRTPDPPSPPRALDQTTDYRPSPVPASNGHTPTAIGRTTSMFSPAKAITAGLIMALVGSLLASGILAPATPTEVVPGADASVAASDATDASEAGARGGLEFTGKLRIAGGFPSGTPGVIRYRYVSDAMNDPRLEGDWVLDYTQSLVDFGHLQKYLYNASFRMENEEGAWQEEPNLTLEYPDGTASSRTSALVGEGAYAGLTAIAELTYVPQGRFEIRGVITDGPVPNAPR